MDDTGGRRDLTATLVRWWGPTILVVPFALYQVAIGRTYRGWGAIAVALAWMIGSSFHLWPRIRWLLPGVAPALVATAFGLAYYFDRAATAASVASVVLLGLLAAGVDAGRLMDRIVHAITTAIREVAGIAFFVLLIIPGWAWTRLRRHDPVRPGPRHTGPAWLPAAGDGGSTESLGTTGSSPAPRLGLTGRLAWAVGCVVLILALNYGAGWAWDRTYPTDVTEPVAAEAPTLIPDAPATPRQVTRDPRADLPAMAAYPWRERYFDDIQRTSGGYWPFTESRPADFTSPYVNLRGWTRKSYEPSGDPASMPTVWMFGGSTAWGEGQRDDYTIASWVARIAEEAGTPLRISNYGQRGWTHFQEMVLYEQRLGLQEPPEFSIFYDGANEANAQSLLEEAAPSHTLAYTYAKELAGMSIATEIVPAPPEPDLMQLVRDKYAEHSAVKKIIDYFQQPAGAAPAQSDPAGTDDEPGTGFTGNQETVPGGAVYTYKVTDQDGTDAGKVYERGKLLTLALSKEYRVKPFLIWQPIDNTDGPYQKAREQLTDTTIDLSEVLADHHEVFIDGGHTNEEGARIVAEEIWKRLGPSVRAWYRDHGSSSGSGG